MNRTVITVLVIGGALAAFAAIQKLREINTRDVSKGIVTGAAGAVGGAVEGLGQVADTVSLGLLGRFGRFVGDVIDPINQKTLDELTPPPEENGEQPGKDFRKAPGVKLRVAPPTIIE